VVLRVNETFISVLEADRYTVESDGLMIRNGIVREGDNEAEEMKTGNGKVILPFSLGVDDVSNSKMASSDLRILKMIISKHSPGENVASQSYHHSDAYVQSSNGPTPTASLNPHRPPDVLSQEIFDLVSSQMKYIVGLSHRQLIQNTAKAVMDSVLSTEHHGSNNPNLINNFTYGTTTANNDFFEILWGFGGVCSTKLGGNKGVRGLDGEDVGGNNERRRGRSPVMGRGPRASSLESRKSNAINMVNSTAVNNTTNSMKYKATTSTNATKNNTNNEKLSAANDSGNDTDSNHYDSDNDEHMAIKERKPRSHSLTTHRSTRFNNHHHNGIAGIKSGTSNGNNGNVKKKPDNSGALQGSDSISRELGVDVLAARQIAILKTIPPELMRRFSGCRGPIYNTWMVGHPLILQSNMHSEVVQSIIESSLSDSKKLEWELDALREHDEKKMDRLEKILISKRNSGVDNINGMDSSLHLLMKTKSGRQKPSNGSNLVGNNYYNGTNNVMMSSISGGVSSMTSISYLNGNNSIVGNNNNGSGSGTYRNNNTQFIEYYRDKGRQPYK